MDALKIEGNVPLKGQVEVSGAKNAALPILFATLLADTPITLHNVPILQDIRTTLKLLEVLGLNAELDENTHTVQTCLQKPGSSCNAASLQPEAPYDLVKTMRASVLCLGPLLARTGHARVAMPGGCAIGARPVDMHLKGLERLGATFELAEGYIIGTCEHLTGGHITFDITTVTGTENVLMAAVLADGESIMENAAREPEIVDLARFLNSLGAQIEGAGTSVLRIKGVPSLTPPPNFSYSIMPDRIEAGTFLLAAGITGGELFVKNCPFADMEALISKLEEAGMVFTVRKDGASVARGYPTLRGVDISTRPHPGFPTDMQAQSMALLSLAEGASIIEETIFENRFMHVQELARMGADIKVHGNSATVRGVKKLNGAPVMASDLRASASLVLAGLAAQGTTLVQRIYHLDRGYEQMEKKLEAVGARIQRVKGE